MYSDVDHWVKSCVHCAMKKTPRTTAKAPLLPIPVEGPFDRVAVDCVGPFPPSRSGNRYLVVFSWLGGPRLLLCHALKIQWLPISSSTKSWLVMAHLAHFFLTRGRNFLSQLVSEVCRILDTKQLRATAYHPQTDGLVERFNGTPKPNHVVDFLLHYLDDFHTLGHPSSPICQRNLDTYINFFKEWCIAIHPDKLINWMANNLYCDSRNRIRHNQATSTDTEQQIWRNCITTSILV